jgi:hypothetical protein
MSEGQLLFGAGDLAGSAALLDEAERVAREAGSPWTLATVLNMQASLALARDDDRAALECWTESAELADAIGGSTWTMTYTWPGLAVLAARRGWPELFAAGSATAEAASLAVTFPADLESLGRWLPVVRERLGEEGFRRAWERGRQLRPADVSRLSREISARTGPG